jgi:hypothetical protein
MPLGIRDQHPQLQKKKAVRLLVLQISKRFGAAIQQINPANLESIE